MLNAPPRALIRLRGPGNQDNWWHALVGAPFFLAFPMIWLRLRAVFSKQLSTSIGRRSIWIAVGLSTCGAISVQVPFRRVAKRLYCRPCDPTRATRVRRAKPACCRGCKSPTGKGMVSVRFIESLFYQVKATDLQMLAIPSLAILAGALLSRAHFFFCGFSLLGSGLSSRRSISFMQRKA